MAKQVATKDRRARPRSKGDADLVTCLRNLVVELMGVTFFKTKISELGAARPGQFIRKSSQETNLINVPRKEKTKDILRLGSAGPPRAPLVRVAP